MCQKRPTMRQKRPNMRQKRPITYQKRPTMRQRRPNMCQNRPTIGYYMYLPKHTLPVKALVNDDAVNTHFKLGRHRDSHHILQVVLVGFVRMYTFTYIIHMHEYDILIRKTLVWGGFLIVPKSRVVQ
jgi:hypothetical protein